MFPAAATPPVGGPNYRPPTLLPCPLPGSHHHHHFLKLLEIIVFSAQDLAPVSKALRPYAVAWVDPDQKLTTRVDHHGHVNPTWNYRFVFQVDDRFLSSSAAVTIQIFNASWLRDIPIGTVHVPADNLVPDPTGINSASIRHLALPIQRPNSSIHGTLHLGVNLIDYSPPRIVLESELSAFSRYDNGDETDENMKRQISERSYYNEEKEDGKAIQRSRSSSSVGVASVLSWFKLGKRAKSKAGSVSVVSSSSFYMRPLPSEVAASMAKGLYSTSTNQFGSSIFENWTELGSLSTKQKSSGQNHLWHAEEEEELKKQQPVECLVNHGVRRRRLRRRHEVVDGHGGDGS
ncbi:uncharacterized protein LOC127797012 [Diospyros lotus]|uniref:uncharacterized protein LOC127797012 n=1 Tax=Diospyros lotus TaxID=55363 RepID=UPI00224CA01A|nr:uncharacterized protein LOC127797012 [Diospyros lotus]